MKEDLHSTEEYFLKGYNEYSDAIYRFCFLKTSDKNVALDITQETFTKTWEYMSEGNEIKEMRPLLYRVAANLVIDYYRKKKTDSLDILTQAGFEARDTTSQTPQQKSEVTELYAKLEKLEPKYKDILILRFINDLPVKEIAEIYDEHENTISVRIHRAVEKLKEIYL